jgi:hypothetical protein
MARWQQRPEGSNWGDFGADDQLGRINLLTPERRRRAAAEIKEGIAFSLSLPLDFPGGSALTGNTRFPPKLFAAGAPDGPAAYNIDMQAFMPGCRDISCDDAVTLYTQYSTQWDSFAHWGEMFDADGDGVPEKVYYNGFRAGIDLLGPDQEGGPYAKALGMEHMAATGAQGRGVLINLHAIYGDAYTPIGYDNLMHAIEQQKIEVLPGDFCCIYTGFDAALLAMNKVPDAHALHHFGAALDGSDQRLLQWITDSGVVALCSDNMAVEGIGDLAALGGSGRHDYTILPLHEHCLFKIGVHLGELWLLRDLAAWLQAHDRAGAAPARQCRLPAQSGGNRIRASAIA